MNKILFLLLSISLLGCSTPEQSVSPEQAILNEFERQLQKDLDDDNLNGSFSMAIVKGDELVRSTALGLADLDMVPADTNSLYRVGSVSKSFTAFLMMTQVQKGLISLDEPVEKYLPEVKQIQGYTDSPPFTFRQLASHTSGLAHLPKARYKHGSVAEWEDLLLEFIPKTHMVNKPGQKYLYSNIGFGILGLALSRAANTPFIELMQQEVFTPLGMSNTFYEIPESKISQLAKGRAGGPMGGYDDARPQREIVGRGWSVPNGGIWSTASDLARFMHCNLGYCSILRPENLALMQTIQTPAGGWQQVYGLGFTIYQDSTLHTIGHEGGTPGYRANFLFDKNSEYGVILLRNYNWGITNLNLRSTVLLRKLNRAQLPAVKN